MGSLIINKVKYSGKKYFFESPCLGKGINIIEGDNGSGKSTFLYLIEYCLGGNVRYFNRSSKDEKYTQILEDEDNYVEVIICLNQSDYIVKRFFGSNDVFVNDGVDVTRWSLDRRINPVIFSDWLLKKLGVKPFQLNLGSISWYFNFNDIYRLLNYDQDTELRKIFKAPANENFITDSSVIRKSTFESLIGISSIEYFSKLNEFNKAKKEKNETAMLLEHYKEMHPNLNDSLESVLYEINELEERLEKLIEARDKYQFEKTHIDEKIIHIEEINTRLIDLEISISETEIAKKNLQVEKEKVQKIYEDIENEISQINRIIYTHNKLDLFSLEICPFCMNETERHEGLCICGNKINKEAYEKFVYKPNEYKDILKHKIKSLETVNIALESYGEEISFLEDKNTIDKKEAIQIKEKIKSIISKIVFSGDSQLIDKYNEEILFVKEELLAESNKVELYQDLSQLEKKFVSKVDEYKDVSKEKNEIEKRYRSNNKKMINEFNAIYQQLMSQSSCESKSAKIDEDYMPFIDGGEYKEISVSVPRRLMYYFTVFAMGLKYKTVKHPHVLLIDTPEAAGIDDDNLKKNIKLFEKAVELSERRGGNNEDYQMILTTGPGKYPLGYEKYIRLKFNKTEGNYILQKKY